MDRLDMPRKMREVKSTLAQRRAVAQLGRAPGAGRAVEKYPHFLPRGLICFFRGKPLGQTLSQVFLSKPKKHPRWTKKWTKLQADPFTKRRQRAITYWPTGMNSFAGELQKDTA